MPVHTVGGRTFSSKNQIKQLVREIVARTPLGAALAGDDFYFVRDLLDRHPSADQKIGPGIAAIFTHSDEWGHKALKLRRVDGTSTDFSWVKCIDRFSMKREVYQCLRREVADQTRAAKEAVFPHEGATAACPLSGKTMTWKTAHVDHAPPDTFDILATAFLASERLAPNDVRHDHGDNIQQSLLADRALAERWRSYHRQRARLRVIDGPTHLVLVR